MMQSLLLTSHHFAAILPVIQTVYSWTESEFINLLRTAVQEAELTIVGETSFTFTPHGVSAAVLLAESHVALHFWPEHGKITIDIHICDYNQSNHSKAEHLADLLTQALSGTSNLSAWKQFTAQG
ncbi:MULTISPECIES: S-adenosylmethionine decarboxylase [unclassified Leptolyngbya]|uniref:S-adenosylmethionine decarboxylase family protein n=1 Tax=unclassified Leptolyngbya TaxID=2650499 RepID=UPI0018EFB742|nr:MULTISPECIES: S-adenosylmethionine decarboxylase [unclassified Leptolyngbya]